MVCASCIQVPGTLVTIIRLFDLVVVQEIRDAAMTSPGELLDLVNANLQDVDKYALLLSGRYANHGMPGTDADV